MAFARQFAKASMRLDRCVSFQASVESGGQIQRFHPLSRAFCDRPSMSERFFVAEPIAGPKAVLSGDEARHLTAVMRLSAGHEVLLFDGSGAQFVARIATIGKHSVELDIV